MNMFTDNTLDPEVRTNADSIAHVISALMPRCTFDVCQLISDFGCMEFYRCSQCEEDFAFTLRNGTYVPPVFCSNKCRDCRPPSFGSVAALFLTDDEEEIEPTLPPTQSFQGVAELFATENEGEANSLSFQNIAELFGDASDSFD